ncbi:hypothetical protein C4K11_2455 [Pseudomonas chlororaphis subsp. aureofaciens]|nr:hypothetical protein C4K11_2455 [Pseudomonas chlororaphis subsp. aureofaciens]
MLEASVSEYMQNTSQENLIYYYPSTKLSSLFMAASGMAIIVDISKYLKRAQSFGLKKSKKIRLEIRLRLLLYGR